MPDHVRVASTPETGRLFAPPVSLEELQAPLSATERLAATAVLAAQHPRLAAIIAEQPATPLIQEHYPDDPRLLEGIKRGIIPVDMAFDPTVIIDEVPVTITALVSGLTLAYTVLKGRQEKVQEREKRDEERFRLIVNDLNNPLEAVKANAVTLLGQFLEPQYERFHQQVLQLATTGLRTREPFEGEKKPSAFYSGLIALFMKSYHLNLQHTFPAKERQGLLDKIIKKYPDQNALDQPEVIAKVLEDLKNEIGPHLTEIHGIHLDYGFCVEADLSFAFSIEPSAKGANLGSAKMSFSYLINPDLTEAWLRGADFGSTYLLEPIFQGATLTDADFTNASITLGDFTGVRDLTGANLHKAIKLEGVTIPSRWVLKDYVKRCEELGAKIV